MLYFFTGNSDFLIREKISAWKQHFISKFGEFNLIHIKDIETVDNNFLVENIISTSFLSEKKLVIIDLNEKISEDKQELLLKILNKIPESNIILVNGVNPDKRSKFYKKLVKISDLKEYNTKDDSNIYSFLKNKYGSQITSSGINTIIKYKSSNLNKIVSEIDKLLILYKEIDSKEIIENITPELEESIFQIIDEILNNNINSTINKIDIILTDTNIYSFYNNLIANLRTTIYISKFKYLNIANSQITSLLSLGNRAFLINKKYKINHNKLIKLYTNLVNIDKKMKSGNLNGTEEIDFKFELERVLLS